MVSCLQRKEMKLGTLLKAKLQRKIHAVGEGIEEWRVGIRCEKDQNGWDGNQKLEDHFQHRMILVPRWQMNILSNSTRATVISFQVRWDCINNS